MRVLQPNQYGSTFELARCLQSFAAFELLKNSAHLFIHLPVLENLSIISNRSNEYAPIMPESSIDELSIVQFLSTLSEMGTSINICYRDEISNLVLENLEVSSVDIQQRDSIYPPGWFTENYAISGIMYFQNDGVKFYENEITITTDDQTVESFLLKAKETW